MRVNVLNIRFEPMFEVYEVASVREIRVGDISGFRVVVGGGWANTSIPS